MQTLAGTTISENRRQGLNRHPALI